MSKPVYGSPTAAMSLSSRAVPHAALAHPGTACCHAGAVNRVLHPPPVALNCLNSDSCEGRPLLFHTLSRARVPAVVSLSEVPPTATTVGSDAGASGWPGASPNWA